MTVFYPSNNTLAELYKTTLEQIQEAEFSNGYIYTLEFTPKDLLATDPLEPGYFGKIQSGKIDISTKSYTTLNSTTTTSAYFWSNLEVSKTGFVSYTIPETGLIATNGTTTYTVSPERASYAGLFYDNHLFFQNSTGTYVYTIGGTSTKAANQYAGEVMGTTFKLENTPRFGLQYISVYDNDTGTLKFINPETLNEEHTINVNPEEVLNFMFDGVGDRFLAEAAVNLGNSTSTEVFLIDLTSNNTTMVNATAFSEYPAF